jgi:dTDP-4-amino-4,6-dideoxygalactose transaminase
MRIPIARPELGPEEEAAVLEVMRSGVLVQGARVRAFEAAFAAVMGARYAIATSNGTTALQLALLAHGVGPGDEVITSPLTFIASANAIVHTGARPVFADVDASLNLDPRAAAAMIGPRTKALMPVHLHGNPSAVPEFVRLAERHGLALIQDACQAIGATIEGRALGTFGTACYSLYATKNLTTGEGGMIITNDAEVARVCASLRHQAYAADAPYLHEAVGFNFRMTEMQAAIGVVQLKKLDRITRRRQENAAFYDEAITLDGLSRPRVAPGHQHVYHQYVLRASTTGPRSREALLAGLEQSGIAAGVHYPIPVHQQPPYRHYGNAPCPEAERAATEIFSIPVHPGVSDADREFIAQRLNEL